MAASKNFIVRAEFWAALGLSTSSVTALRFGESPIGYSEIILAFSLMLVFFSSRSDPKKSVLFWFWIVSLSTLSVGLVLSFLRSDLRIQQIIQDSISLLFSAFLSILFYMILSDKERRSFFLQALCWFSFALLSLTLVNAFLLGTGWEFGSRLYGFSKNPNQLALFCLVNLSSIVLYWGECTGKERSLAKMGMFLITALLVGYLTASDAFNLAFLLSVAVFLVAYLVRAPKGGRVVGSINVLALVLSPLILFYFYLKIPILLDFLLEVSDDGDQGSIRFALWENGIEAIYLSPLWGWGPGAWSGLISPLSGAEAHNTYIDWATKTGLVGLSAILILNFLCLKRAFFTNRIAFFSIMTGVLFFSFFHLIIRQPGYWFLIAASLSLFPRPIVAR